MTSFSDKLEYALATSHHGKCLVYYIQPETQQPGECRCRLRGAKERIIKLIKQQEQEAVYGFHEYLIGKNIIRQETDQAFNYARLHKALDDYITELQTQGERDILTPEAKAS